MHVAIIDYGSGNLHSAAKAFERAAREHAPKLAVKVTSKPEQVRAAERIVLPGVGAFADCREGLARIPGMIETLEEAVRERGKPFSESASGSSSWPSAVSNMGSRRDSAGSRAR